MSDEIEIDLNAPEAPAKLAEKEPPAKPKDDDIEVVAEGEDGKKPEVSADDGIDALKKQLEAERQKGADDRRRASEAEARAREAQAQVSLSQLDVVTAAIEKKKADNTTLKQQYSAALAAGDYDKAAEVQEALSFNAATLNNLEMGKHRMESAARQPVEPQISSDPVEALIHNGRLSQRSAQWVRSHPEYASGPNFNRMIGAHNLAVGDGMAPDTDEYFAHVEQTLKLREAPPVESRSEAAEPVQRRSAPPAAPVSRHVTPSGQRDTNRVVLTKLEQEAARDFGMTDREYAQNKRALIAEGKLGQTTH